MNKAALFGAMAPATADTAEGRDDCGQKCASQFFEDEWAGYQRVLDDDNLGHVVLYASVRDFIASRCPLDSCVPRLKFSADFSLGPQRNKLGDIPQKVGH